MSEAQSTKVHSHIDGGTFRTVAFAATQRGFGITITEWTTYKGAVVFEVNREDARGRLFRLAQFGTEADARARANREYRADKYGSAA